jgi:hypothetical protein
VDVSRDGVGTAPIETALIFDTLEECLRADDQMRASYAQVVNALKSNQSAKKDIRSFVIQQSRLQNQGTCIPHAALSSR